MILDAPLMSFSRFMDRVTMSNSLDFPSDLYLSILSSLFYLCLECFEKAKLENTQYEICVEYIYLPFKFGVQALLPTAVKRGDDEANPAACNWIQKTPKFQYNSNGE
jgi:hypothetical protein